MSNLFPHLHEKATSLMGLTEKERIFNARKQIWIGYPAAKSILAKLDDLFEYPKSDRMPNLLIQGRTNNGKTMLARRFYNFHPPDDNPDGETAKSPVVYVQAPSIPDEGQLVDSILYFLNAPFRPTDKFSAKSKQLKVLLTAVDTRILIIDEIHNMLAGGHKKQSAYLNYIKGLGNDMQISIVCIGTKLADRALVSDDQMSNRFDPAYLPRWQLDKNFLSLLASFEKLIPLAKPSNLCDPNIVSKVLSMSEGYLGEISRILTTAAVLAIRSGTEKIDQRILNKMDWTVPSMRRKRPEIGD
ncbi:TniB family NTP-binding protein [Maridesulfovibrio sp.]|uniref:TniB family NTP-binding protein n=1 Tax=Maridesulfovibrio sp. TaxID=2795000 RepID=UPI0039F11516